MTILFRRNGGTWQSAAEVSYPHEAHLQHMLYDSPNLIPVRGGDEALGVFIKEAGLPGSGSTDLLGVDLEGNIYIVECKLASNLEIRRKVIGQILEYAAFLWETPYENLDRLFVQREGKSIIDLLSERAKQPFDSETFRSRVAQNLQSGSFDLMIAVDEINDELRQIIRYLTSCGSGIRLQAIEMSLFRSGDTEILVPKIHGREIQESPPGGKTLTIEQVLGNCPDETCRSRLGLLVDEWKRLGHHVVPGTKGLSFRAQIDDEVRPVFQAMNPEYVCVNFRSLQAEGLPDSVIDSFKNKISRIKGFNPASVATQKEPRAYFSVLKDGDVKDIVQANNDLVVEWRKQRL